MKQTMRFNPLTAFVLTALALSGCATEMNQALSTAAVTPAPVVAPVSVAPAPVPTPAPAPVAAKVPQAQEFYVVLSENGRYYAFGDTKNYFSFLSHAEVPLTRTNVGAGPGGKTIVYGITSDDVKKNMPSLAEQILNGSLAPAADFYGEVVKNGRFYVFGDLKDMTEFAAVGEVPYSFTDVGTGPKGETLVWVLNKNSIKKGRPIATIDRFKAIRASMS